MHFLNGFTGIVFTDNTPEWKRIHQNVLSVLREFGFGDKNIMEERITTEIEAMVEFGGNTRGKPFDPKQLCLLISSNITTNILFGSRRSYDLGISELVSEVDHYFHLMDMIFDVAPFLKFIPPFKRKLPAIKSCHKKIYDMIETEIDQSLLKHEKCFVSEFIAREGPDYDRDYLFSAKRFRCSRDRYNCQYDEMGSRCLRQLLRYSEETAARNRLSDTKRKIANITGSEESPLCSGNTA